MPPVLLSRYARSLQQTRTASYFPVDSLLRGLDPLLGIFTGVFAYYLRENNPRTAPPDDEKLVVLARWKWTKQQQERREKWAAAEAAALVEGRVD